MASIFFQLPRMFSRRINVRPTLRTPHSLLSINGPYASQRLSRLHFVYYPLVAPARSVNVTLPKAVRLRPGLPQFFQNEVHRSAPLQQRTVFVRRFSPQGRTNESYTSSSFLESISPNVIFWGILVLNGTIYLAWQYAYTEYKQGDPRLLITMFQNFTSSLRNLQEGRIWSLVTCCFSQSETAHLLVNLFTYYFMAKPVLFMLGNTQFLALYLGGGIVSSLTSMTWHYVKGQNDRFASHGGSGAIYALISWFACARPTSTFLIFGILPCPAWVFVTGIFVYDTLGTLADKRTRTDTAGHVGGLLAGMSYFLARRLRLF